MNNIENFDTVFTTFPLFYIGMIVAGLSYITFAVMMNLGSVWETEIIVR
ncbi:hypothetical protein MXI02_002070 [Salmonella enterica]|nr:hypothetical protein [Salmonella enterica]EKI6155042.1 hypothetical protein [Salmonella enterica]EMB7541201.1 hypothetical protein [Salmonella enterica]